MITSFKSTIVSFFGFQMIDLVYNQSVYEYFQTEHFFEKKFVRWLMIVRGLALLAVFIKPNLQFYLIDLRVTDTWIKYIFWVLLLHKYFSVPVYTKCVQHLIHRKHDHWKRMLFLYQHLANRLTFKREAAAQYARMHQIPYTTSASHLNNLNKVILASMINSLWYNVLVTIIESINLIESIQLTWSWQALTIQLLSYLNFKYVFNFDSEGFAVCLMLLYPSIFDFELRLKTLNSQLNRLASKLRTNSLAYPSNFSNVNNLMLRFEPKNEKLYNKIVLDISQKLNRIADEQLFTKQVTCLLAGNFYLAGIVCSVGYFFLIYLGENLLVSRQVLIFGVLFLFISILLPFCWIAQRLIDQVKKESKEIV